MMFTCSGDCLYALANGKVTVVTPPIARWLCIFSIIYKTHETEHPQITEQTQFTTPNKNWMLKRLSLIQQKEHQLYNPMIP